MTTTIAGTPAVLNPETCKSDIFREHVLDEQKYFQCSTTKVEPLRKTPFARLGEFEFWQPTPNFARSIIIDIDRENADWYINDLPADLKPHAMIFTTKGLQAYWMIEGVTLTKQGRIKPILYARDVAALIQAACDADTAVDPLTPVKCRNPFFEGADIHFMADRGAYSLGELNKGFKALLKSWKMATDELENVEWDDDAPKKRKPLISSSVAFGLVSGQRNLALFNITRKSAYLGEDFETVAYEANKLSEEPLPDAEVACIVRSVDKFMRTRYKGKGGQELTPEERAEKRRRGAYGGSRNTEAQKAARAKLDRKAGNRASADSKKAKAAGKRGEIQYWKEQNYSQKEVAKKLGVGIATVKRHWN